MQLKGYLCYFLREANTATLGCTYSSEFSLQYLFSPVLFASLPLPFSALP
jgi:hypothetical protein